MPHALKGFVIQVDMRDLNFWVFDRFHIHTETVVLCSNLHPSCQKILDWMVCASMAELQFKGLSAKGETQDLMAQTDAKDGIIFYQIPDDMNSIGDRLRISWSV